jgi:transmembrane 9 superfamily member 2/4
VCPPRRRKYSEELVSGTSMTLNLGEVLRGDRIMVSDYELKMLEDQEARYLCSVEVDRKGVQWAKDIIKEGYVAEWIVDNLPGATTFMTTDKSRRYYAAGFKMGYAEAEQGALEPRFFLNNHVTLVIRYHDAPGRAGAQGKKVIVGFEVFPKSIEARGRNQTGLPPDVSNVNYGMELSFAPNTTITDGYNAEETEEDPNAKLVIPYTYSVYFREERNLEWKNRWDMYFVAQENSSRIHWLAIINSIVIVAILTAAVAVIFTRTIKGEITAGLEDKGGAKRLKIKSSRRGGDKKGGLLDPMGDVEQEGDLSSDEEALEDVTGWKLVHGDVFRAPAYGGLLAPLVGSGTQLIFMASGLIGLSAFGVLNPSFRGGYVSVGIALFVFAGLFSGYFSARIYKTFGGQLWQKNMLVVSTVNFGPISIGLS